MVLHIIVAPTRVHFADRDPTYTWSVEGDAWQRAKKLYRIRGTCLENEATFFSPKMAWGVASVSTANPSERITFVDIGTSMLYDECSLHQKIGNRQSVSPSHDCDHHEGSRSTQPRRPQSAGNIRTCSSMSNSSKTLQQCHLWANSAKKMSVHLSGQKVRHQILRIMVKRCSATATTSCLSLFLVY